MSRSRRGFGRAALLVLAGLATGLGTNVSPASAADQAPDGAYPVGDFNGDGFGDFVARRGEWPGVLVVAFGSAGPGVVQLPGEGGTGVEINVDGTPARDYSSTAYFQLPSRVGDVDGDGKDDIAVVSNVNRSWIVYGGEGTGTIKVGVPGPRVTALVHDYHHLGDQVLYGIGDFNGDGLGDWLQSRYSPVVTGTSAALPKVGGGVIVLGGPRVPELETRGTGPRRIQVNTSARCSTRWYGFIPSTTCWWVPLDLAAIGDYDRDGKADLHSSHGFVLRGRESLATTHGTQPDANTIVEPVRPKTNPWTAPGPVPPQPDPSGSGFEGWTFDNAAYPEEDGSVNLVRKGMTTGTGSVYDTSQLRNANELVVDFDLQLVDSGSWTGNGNGATLAFASKGQGGVPRAANHGIGLGWVGNKGNAITFGTVKGTYTPSDNYVGIAAGGVGKSGYPVFLQTAPAVSRLRNSTNHITFKATGGVVTVSINGVERLRRTQTLPTDAYVGFTAGSSGAMQDHIVKNVVIKKP